MRGAKQQALLLTAVNGVVRALGLVMRAALSRLLGAEIMGLTELCSGVHQLAIAPLTSGLPLAISRMTAQAPPGEKRYPLLAGLWLARIGSAALIPALLLFSPALARLMGDARVLPSLWLTAPCVLVLGYSASYNGYSYGIEKSWVPAASELIEQLVRFGLAVGLAAVWTGLTAAWLAAVPVFATLVAEMAGLWFALSALRVPLHGDARALRRPVLRLAAPATATRVINTGLRSVSALLIPLRLQASGLTQAESVARLGMLNGMAAPITLLPCIFTSALSMVLLPKLAKAERDRARRRRLLWLSLGASAGIGALCAALIYIAAPLLAVRAFRQPELAGVLRASCPLTALCAVSHAASGAMAGLGMQKRALYGALIASSVSLALIYPLTADPALRLYGALIAQTAAQAAGLLWNLACMKTKRRAKPDHSAGLADAPA